MGLLVRHSGSKSEMFGLSCHVIVAEVEHHMLPLNRTLTIGPRRVGMRKSPLISAQRLCPNEKEEI